MEKGDFIKSLMYSDVILKQIVYAKHANIYYKSLALYKVLDDVEQIIKFK